MLTRSSIIAVHDLVESPSKTWTKFIHPKSSKLQADQKDAESMWLRDTLPKDFPEARVLVYNYSYKQFLDDPKYAARDLELAIFEDGHGQHDVCVGPKLVCDYVFFTNACTCIES